MQGDRLLVVAALGLAVASACSPPQQDTMLVRNAIVDAGGETLQGVVLDADSELAVYRGIPYAAPPKANRRWRPPAAHTPRSGTQDASKFAPACPQLQGNHDWYRRVAVLFGNPPDTIGPLENIDEDCLYLNVWTSAKPATEKQPVMVWLHGGSNINGYGHEPNNRGHAIAERGIVFVSINYRLGVLGFMAHAGLSAESPHGISGNYALLDQVAALQWIQENISAFGGDPDNVTVIGESSGGYNIAWLVASQMAEGLFRRAIIQSGGWAVNSFQTLEQAEQVGESIASSLGMEKPLSPVEIIEAMRELDWENVLDGANTAYSGWYDAVTDGYFLTAPAASLFAQGEFKNVDLLIGANANERYMYLAEDVDEVDLDEMVAEHAGTHKDKLSAILKQTSHPGIRRVMDRLGSRGDGYLCASKYIAGAMAKKNQNVFFYFFTRIRPGGKKTLAYHGAEIPYALGTADDWLPGDKIDLQLSDTMMQYWVNFAATGSPNGAGLPAWPAYSVDDQNYLELGDSISSETKLETEICAILDQRRTEILINMNER